jgi:type I restriction enzyme S subunit
LLSLTLRGVIVRDLTGMKGKFPASFETYQVVEPGDLVLCMFDVEETPRTVGLSIHHGMITGAYDVYRSDDSLALEYLTRLLLVLDENKSLAPLYRGLRKTIPRSAFESLKVPMPSKDEQRLIVRYLDHAELRVAKAIAAKQDVVRLLREARLAMISETVLAGNGADVERVESGIPGVGFVPTHWRIRRAKYVWEAVDVRSTTGTEERLTVSSASGIVPRSSKNVTMFEAASYVGHKVVQPKDLVINSLWAWAGGLGVSNHHGLVSPVYGVYRLRDEAQCDPEFMHNLLRSNASQWQFQVRSKGIWRSRLSITDEAFFDMPLPLPPLEEQQTIAAAIREKTANVDRAIDSVLNEIALLKEYRTRLISDVVTGKLDVRNEAAKLPDIDPMELATVSLGENGDDEEATDGD